jgi:hypothetical protein
MDGELLDVQIEVMVRPEPNDAFEVIHHMCGRPVHLLPIHLELTRDVSLLQSISRGDPC